MSERPHLRHEAMRTECASRVAAWDSGRVSARPVHASNAHAVSPSLLPADDACELSSTGADSPEMQRAARSACARTARTGGARSAADPAVTGDTLRAARGAAKRTSGPLSGSALRRHRRRRSTRASAAASAARRISARAAQHCESFNRCLRKGVTERVSRRAQPERARPQERKERADAALGCVVPAKVLQGLTSTNNNNL